MTTRSVLCDERIANNCMNSMENERKKTSDPNEIICVCNSLRNRIDSIEARRSNEVVFWPLLKQYKNKTKTICGECRYVDIIICFLIHSHCPLIHWKHGLSLTSEAAAVFFLAEPRVKFQSELNWFEIVWKYTYVYITLTSDSCALCVHFKIAIQRNGDNSQCRHHPMKYMCANFPAI